MKTVGFSWLDHNKNLRQIAKRKPKKVTFEPSIGRNGSTNFKA